MWIVVGGGAVWLKRSGGKTGDPFGFAQGRLFTTPENGCAQDYTVVTADCCLDS
jgi:hypothetical protein